ncbi:MAG: hypothetical protein KAJ88_00810 [Candidatus Aenigmarchaeota archaeon]|nr:hypothetical protein [Candidatus Aenigmarchaeota archaeon]
MYKPARFSTDNADYCLNYGDHFTITDIEDIEQYDAIVVETGFRDYDDWDLKYLKDKKQHIATMEENLKLDNPVPIFYVDIPSTKSIIEKGKVGYYLGAVFEALLLFLPVLPIIPFSLSMNSGNNEIYDEITSKLSLSAFYTPLGGFRSSASAHKIEEFIVPELTKRNGRKPNIFIDFGSSHCDMKQYLQHKRIRNLVNKFHEKTKIGSILNDYDYLDKVCELRPKDLSFEPCANDKVISREDDVSSFDGWEKIVYDIF